MKANYNRMKEERKILDTAFAISNMLNDMIEYDEKVAGRVYKCVIQYLQEKTQNKIKFTEQELKDFGYLS